MHWVSEQKGLAFILVGGVHGSNNPNELSSLPYFMATGRLSVSVFEITVRFLATAESTAHSR